MDETAQQMSRGSQRTGQIPSGYLTEAQEINPELPRRATETWIEAFRKKTELNQRMIQRIYSETEGQTGVWQGLMQEWMSAYSGPFNPFGSVNPFDFLCQGVKTATRSAERVTDMAWMATAADIASANGGFPIAGYDD
jgi:hypothetical protein